MGGMTLARWHADAVARLEAGGCPDPEADARLLEEAALELPPERLRRLGESPLDAAQTARLEALLSHRLAGEPVQYVTGTAWFYGLPFHVDARVLIPRFDTENLVEAALGFLKTRGRAAEALDVCTGSGAIGLSLAALLPGLRVTLTDLSEDALAVARLNAEALGVSARAELLLGDLFAPVAGRTFDVICVNPPYIPTGELAGLQREVQSEPVLALDGGADGLDLYRRIAREAGERLVPGGRVYLEVGIGQARTVLDWLSAALHAAERGIIHDLNGIERVVWAEKPI